MTMYAQVIDGAVIAVTGVLPAGAKRLDTGQWITPYERQWTVAEHEACGWFVVVDVARPADSPTTTHVRTLELVAGVPTEVWTQRPKTAGELAADTAATNRTTIEQQATAARSTNATYLAITTPTNAQVAAQVKDLTRQNNKIIRLILNQLDATD